VTVKGAGRVKAVTVGMNSCGLAAGAQDVYDALVREVHARGLELPVKRVGCVGACYREPLVDVVTGDAIYTYYEVTAEKVVRIVEEHVVGGRPVDEWVLKRDVRQDGDLQPTDIDGYFAKQRKVVLKHIGYIDPENIDEYIALGGYEPLEKALAMRPADIVDEIRISGLRGRGGAGFPTGMKWKLAREAEGGEKYIICNADEGDPGAFMDRNVLEGDPHAVLEGMVIGAYAMGAGHGLIYVRAEYPLAVKRVRVALAQAAARGYLGDNILGSGFSFSVHIKEGAGAFVCGEETAMIASIEGKRGMPRPRPPYPAEKGLHGRPTNINNVETWANVPWIIANGGQAYASMGTEKSKGTKVFALAGKIKRGGNVEVPMGLTLQELLYDIGGGTKTGGRIKAVQIGGPSGGCIPDSLFNIPVDYDSITATGAIMGSGGMVVMGEDTCMVDIAKFFLDFVVKESCGKCTFCRLGTKRMLEIVDRITRGEGRNEDIAALEKLAAEVKAGSLCGLGQTAPNPVLTTLKYFRDEYAAHIEQKKCPAKVCKALIRYSINEKCTGCTLCAKKCPVQAIHGEQKAKHAIDQDSCIRCGTCLAVCRFDAVEVD